MKKPGLRAADVSRDLRLAAELLEIWRLCGKSCCRRARACNDVRRCSERIADWELALSLKDKRVSFAEAMQLLREPNQSQASFPRKRESSNELN
jgi:hypothetical protein